MFKIDQAIIGKLNHHMTRVMMELQINDNLQSRLDFLTAMRLNCELTWTDSAADLIYLTHINIMIADLEIRQQLAL